LRINDFGIEGRDPLSVLLLRKGVVGDDSILRRVARRDDLGDDTDWRSTDGASEGPLDFLDRERAG
jgi:hypothetical protein